MSSDSSLDSMRSSAPTPMLYGFTIEFLVAKERPCPRDSNTIDDAEDRYVCPSNEKNPQEAILAKCKDVLLHKGQAVSVKQDITSDIKDLNLNDQDQGSVLKLPDHWSLESAPDVLARNGRPLEYEWVGIRLHSPMFPESDFDKNDSAHHRCLAALRNSILIYVGSACRFTFQIRPASTPMDLDTVRKLTALVYVVDTYILLDWYCPNPVLKYSPPYDTLRHRLGQRVQYLKDNHGSMFESAAMTRLREEHMPDDPNSLSSMQAIWHEQSLPELAEALEPVEGRDGAFRVSLDGDGNATAVFRYALWHPHEGLDVSEHWIRLAMCLFRDAELPQTEFWELSVRVMAVIKDGFRDRGYLATAHVDYRRVLVELGFPEDAATAWMKIAREYHVDGGILGSFQLDCTPIDEYPPLGRVDEPV